MIFICRQQDIPVAKEEMIFNYKQEHPALSKAAKRMRIKYENLEYPPAYY
jgi:hypothetical protein